MKFHRVYIEITNICGLECTFCPPKINPTKTMSKDFFEKILAELTPYTKDIALHVMGDPLAISNIQEYLDIAEEKKLNVMITTSGKYLNSHENVFHKCIKQINISLNSFNKNNMKCTFDEYMNGIFKLCEKRVDDDIFINLRLWNLDKNQSEKPYNTKIFKKLSDYFHIDIPKKINQKSFRLAKKILLHFDDYFQWPSLQSTHNSDGFCHGLSSQIAILANGRVVPCCLDGDGIMNLGNLHVESLKEILNSQKAQDIRNDFKNKKAHEELCRKCTFKERFNADL